MLIDASSCSRRAACQTDPLPSILFDFTSPQQSPYGKQKLPSRANLVFVILVHGSAANFSHLRVARIESAQDMALMCFIIALMMVPVLKHTA